MAPKDAAAASSAKRPPEAEIPQLRKEKRERRGAGIFLRGAGPGAGAHLARAAGGSGPLGFGRFAAALAERL
ncbi:MAG: hypothetical protein HY554_01945, partial [Elusimicrobia bacterium]|nr:hypothetical protein [Elusimicrobiota bacterium]